MGNPAIRKPRFLEEVETTSHVRPLAFGLAKEKQDDLGVVRNLDLEKAPPPTPEPEEAPTQKTTTPSPNAGETNLSEEPTDHEVELSAPQRLSDEDTPEATIEDPEKAKAHQLEQPIQQEQEQAQAQEQMPPTPATHQGEMGVSTNIATEKLIRMVEKLQQANNRLAEEARSTALEIGFQVAQRILEKEVAADVTSMIALVRSALRKVGDAKVLRLSLHPQDHERVSKALEDGQFTEIALAQLELVPNATLERGDVVVDTNFGQIDGRIETRLKEIKTVIDDSQEGDPS